MNGDTGVTSGQLTSEFIQLTMHKILFITLLLFKDRGIEVNTGH